MTCVVTYQFLFASKLQEQLLPSRDLPNNFQLQKKKTVLRNKEHVYTLAVTIHYHWEWERRREKKNEAERTRTSDSNLLFPEHFSPVPVCLDTGHKHRGICQGEIIHLILKVLWVASAFKKTNFLRTHFWNIQQWNASNWYLYDA